RWKDDRLHRLSRPRAHGPGSGTQDRRAFTQLYRPTTGRVSGWRPQQRFGRTDEGRRRKLDPGRYYLVSGLRSFALPRKTIAIKSCSLGRGQLSGIQASHGLASGTMLIFRETGEL